MNKINRVIAALVISFLSQPIGHLHAEPRQAVINDMIMLLGRCSNRTILFDESTNFKCSQITNIIYSNGRSGFHTIIDKYAIAFSGMDDKKIRTDANENMQPVDLVIVNEFDKGDPAKPKMLRAVGDCIYQNPYQGIKTTIICNARTELGVFSMSFFHDGSRPIEAIRDQKAVIR